MLFETMIVTYAAFALSPWSIITIYSVLNKNKDTINHTVNTDNFKQVSIYREQFEIGYTSTIKRILNYLLHLSHDELLVSLTVILTIISMIILYFIYRSFIYYCCKKSNKIIYKKNMNQKQLNYRNRF